MLIKFYSEQSAEFVMLDSTAKQLLTMMGHGGSTEGSVSGEALDSALDRLSSAIAREPDSSGSANPGEQKGADGWDEDDDADDPEEVAIPARAAPLIDMLGRAKDEDGYVMWRPE